MVQDVFTPNIQEPTRADKLSDKWHGTSIVATKNMLNNMELQKAINVNKYAWNKEGMIQAGINPLMNTTSLGSISNSQAQSSYNGNVGVFADLLDEPLKIIKKVAYKLIDKL